MQHDFLQILKTLTEFKSITPKSSGSIEYISSLLSQAGFNCDIQYFGEQANKVTNLYAIYGNKSPNICFAGHVDVVPPMNEELWDHDPFKATIIENKIYGRGTVDMKGAISVSLAAALNFVQQNANFNGAISFLLTSDEEGDAENGTAPMLEYIKNHQPKIDLCILGEPTSEVSVGDIIKIGRRGSVNFILKVMGKQGHAAYPEKALNPIPIMIKITKELCDHEFDKGSEFFQPTNLQITSIDTGNYTSNIIPEFLTVRFNVRFNDKQTAETIISAIVKIITKYTDKYDLQYKCAASSFIQNYSPQMQAFTSIVKEQTGISPLIGTSGGTSDARFIHKFAETIEFGLNSNLAHKINEYTEISDLQTLYNVYYISLNKFLNP